MDAAGEYTKGRVKTIVGMAVGFTAMTRVFEKGSRLTIERMIEGFLSSLSDLHDRRQFDALHDDFCDRFTNTIRRAKAKEGEDPRCPSRKLHPRRTGR